LQIACKGLEAEVIVADNASSDGTLHTLPDLFPDVQFLDCNANLGFAKANNLALSKAKGQYILFLNPDTLVPENMLHYCLAQFRNRERLGAIGVQMINRKGIFLPESKRSTPSLSGSFFKLIGLARLFPQSAVFNRYAVGQLNAAEDHVVDVLAGACMMIPKDLLFQTGAFNEAYFMYGEDIDLCLRIKQAGYNILYLGSTTMIHHKGQSLRRGSARQTQLFYDAMLIFTREHYRWYLLLWPFIQLMRFGTSIRNLLYTPVQPKQAPNKAYIISTEGIDEPIRQLLETAGIDSFEIISDMKNSLITTKSPIIFVLPDIALSTAINQMKTYPGLNYQFITRRPPSISFNSENNQF
jgi:GT2 family glycosyltransferase